MKGLVLLFCGFAALGCAETRALFSASSGDGPGTAYTTGPFPTDVLTVSNATRATGLQVNLPSSNDNCSAQPAAACGYSTLLNQLDGFSVNPRLMVCFSGPVNISTIPSGLQIYSTDHPHSQAIRVDRVIWDGATNCAYAKPTNVLLQQKSYVLAVTNAILAKRSAVTPSDAFTACLASNGPYCARLAAALAETGIPRSHLVSGSVFTTMSVTPWLQGAQTLASSLPAVNLPAGLPSSFALSSIKSLSFTADQSGLPAEPLPLSVLTGVKTLSFGLFISPSYINTSGTAAGTITNGPFSPVGANLVSYHVFVPQAHGKVPVVIYVHGSGDTQFGAPTFIASTLAQKGFATLAFELQGHGFGPASSVTVTTTSGATIVEHTPGRGVAIPPGQPIGAESGCIAPGPIGIRDCVRQNAADLFSLIHLIQQTNGLGLGLDPQRIYVVGQSLGSIISSVALPETSSLDAAVLNGDGGSSVDIARLSPVSLPLAEGLLSSLGNPALLNVADGSAPPAAGYNLAFNDNYVFRGEAPVANTITYAMNIQAAFEAAEWLNMLADPVSFGPYLNADPLHGVTPKPALFQFGIGDLEVPNPTETNAVLAAQAQNSTWILNFPKAVSLEPALATIEDPNVPGLPILPHRVLSNPTIFTPGNGAELSLSLAEQDQVAAFFASRGKTIPDPNQFLTTPFSPDQTLFVRGPLPTGLNFLQ